MLSGYFAATNKTAGQACGCGPGMSHACGKTNCSYLPFREGVLTMAL
jgi:hypothetical protein